MASFFSNRVDMMRLQGAGRDEVASASAAAETCTVADVLTMLVRRLCGL